MNALLEIARKQHKERLARLYRQGDFKGVKEEFEAIAEIERKAKEADRQQAA